MADHIQIGDIAPRIQYAANGTQVQFTYPFPIFVAADLEVYLGAAKQSSGFTVAGAGASAGGSVTFAAAPTAGGVVTLRRKIAIQRTSDFQESGEFRAKVINDELDYQTAALQQVADDGARTVRLSPTDAAADLTLPDKAARANKFLACDADGKIIPAAGAAGVPVTGFAQTLLDDADAQAARATLGVVLGTAANNVVQLDGAAKMPAVDGSALTNLPLDTALATDIRLLALEAAALKGDRLNMVNGWADPLKDETDIETAQNVAATFVSTGGGYYHNPSSGYSSDLTGSGTAISGGDAGGFPASGAFDNNLSGTQWESSQGGGGVSGVAYIGYDFGAGNNKHIRRFTIKQHSVANNRLASVKVEWSNNGSSWTIVDTTTIANDDVQNTYNVSASGAARYWRLLANANPAGSWDVQEVEFMEATLPPNLTVVSKQVVAATSAPTIGRLHVQIKDVTGGSTVNTDFKGYVSRDNGTTYTQGTLALVQTLADGTKAYEFDNLSISGQPSGTQPRFKFTTHNNKQIELHGAVVQWK